ncbi:ELMO/CED-12 family-domain-containing protein [Hyaloraphidium curvatum]|nr:ELMO/CED-12 family-domain-containing protein [Hyaloraphidium curvatum]
MSGSQYGPVPFDLSFLDAVYARPALARLYRALKAAVRLVTGKSELQRAVDRAAGGSRASSKSLSSIAADDAYRIGRVIARSTQLEAERATLDSANPDLNAAAVALMRRKRFPDAERTDSARAGVLISALRSLHGLRSLKEDLLATAARPISLSTPADLAKLSDLHRALLDAKAPEGKSEGWKELGFQGTDPSTDVRGAGALAIDDLCHFARNHPGLSRSALDVSRHPTAWFPFAVAGINVTSHLLSLLRSGALDLHLMRAGSSREAWHELYSYLLHSLAEEWASRRASGPLSVLDFNDVFGGVKRRFEAELRAGKACRVG